MRYVLYTAVCAAVIFCALAAARALRRHYADCARRQRLERRERGAAGFPCPPGQSFRDADGYIFLGANHASGTWRLVLGETGECFDGHLRGIIALRTCDCCRSVCVMLRESERPWVSIPLGFLPDEAQRRSCADTLCALLRADEVAK